MHINKLYHCCPVKPDNNDFESGIEAKNHDLLIFYVKIKDKDGIICVENSSEISLIIENGGEILGPSKIKAEAGIASFFNSYRSFIGADIKSNNKFWRKS